MEESSCVRKMILVVSIACLVASRMWLGSDRGSLLLLTWSQSVVVGFLSLFSFFPKKANLSPAFLP